jgi:hypothetical protein
MKLLKPTIILALLALMPATAQAADKDGRFSVRGLGSSKCSDMAAAVDQKNSNLIPLYAAWLSGYLTAANRLISQTFDALPSTSGTDPVGLVTVVCRANPGNLVETAAYQAMEALNSIRIRQDSPLVTIQDGGKSLVIRQEALIMVQGELARLGLFKGAADGKASPALAQAVRGFQKAQKLPESGLPDLDVLIRLKLAPQRK